VVESAPCALVVQISQPQQPLALLTPSSVKVAVRCFFIQRVIDVLNQIWDNLVDLEILVGDSSDGPEIISGVRASSIRIESTSFHDRELVPTLHATRQVVLMCRAGNRAKLVVGAVRQIRRIGRPALHVIQVMHITPIVNPAPYTAGSSTPRTRRAR